MLKNLFRFFKNNFLIEKEKYINQIIIEETKEYNCFNFLYDNFVLEDFANFGKKNYLNKDYEDYVFNDLSYINIYSILKDDIVDNFINDNIDNINLLNLASNSGKIILFANIFYEINKSIGIENIYELYKLSKYILKKLENSIDFNDLLKNYDISFNNEGLLDAKIDDFNMIVIDYNNNNLDFNRMLENKINSEAKNGTLIVKIMEPFEKNMCFELLKTKMLKNNKNNFFVYYYKKIK